jgi:hypothetical protein
MNTPSAEMTVNDAMSVHDQGAESGHLHFFGLRRSGNHAVLGWIEANAENNGFPTVHFNDIHDELMTPPKIPHSGDACLELPVGTGLAIFSYQDIERGDIPEIPFYAEDATEKVTLSVLRDLPNLIASRIKMYEDLDQRGLSHRSVRKITYEQVTQMWVGYAKAYLDAPAPGDGSVNFPLWFQSRDYRNAMFETLNLGSNGDAGLNNVADFGFGSSFDHQSFNGRAQEMDVLERWRQYVGDPHYERALDSHPEARQLMAEFDSLTARYLVRPRFAD